MRQDVSGVEVLSMSKEIQEVNSAMIQTAGESPSDEALPVAPSPLVPGPELDELEHRAWRGFLQKHARLARLLEADLLARNNLPLAEFDVLFQLASAESERLRMSELADRVLLSRAGVTRLVDRLVADGLVSRSNCASDGRGSYAVLTSAGRTRMAESRPAHLTAVKHNFLASMTRDELKTLADLMERDLPPR
jgi:DNA-binding MarR family transcriptional regulator